MSCAIIMKKIFKINGDEQEEQEGGREKERCLENIELERREKLKGEARGLSFGEERGAREEIGIGLNFGRRVKRKRDEDDDGTGKNSLSSAIYLFYLLFKLASIVN